MFHNLKFRKRYLFNINGTLLNVYSIASGELVYRLAYTDRQSSKEGEESNQEILINSICINPINKYQLLSFHQNGKVCVWDYEDGLMLKVEFKILFISKKNESF